MRRPPARIHNMQMCAVVDVRDRGERCEQLFLLVAFLMDEALETLLCLVVCLLWHSVVFFMALLGVIE